MKSKYFSVAVGAAAGLILGISIDGIQAPSGASDKSGEGAPSAQPAADADPRRVKLQPELAKRAKLQVAAVQMQSLKPHLRLVGSVNFDADEVADVGARIEGRVSRVFVFDRRRGQAQAIRWSRSRATSSAMRWPRCSARAPT